MNLGSFVNTVSLIQFLVFFFQLYNFIAKCQYTDCTKNVLWCQVHSSHIHPVHAPSSFTQFMPPVHSPSSCSQLLHGPSDQLTSARLSTSSKSVRLACRQHGGSAGFTPTPCCCRRLMLPDAHSSSSCSSWPGPATRVMLQAT